jgi:hypothetical protein
MVFGLNPRKGKPFFSSPEYPDRLWSSLGFYLGGNVAG